MSNRGVCLRCACASPDLTYKPRGTGRVATALPRVSSTTNRLPVSKQATSVFPGDMSCPNMLRMVIEFPLQQPENWWYSDRIQGSRSAELSMRTACKVFSSVEYKDDTSLYATANANNTLRSTIVHVLKRA